MRRINDLLATVLAMSVGFLMTISLLLDGLGGTVTGLLQAANVEPFVRGFAPVVLQLVTLTLAFTILVGLLNLMGVHTLRTVRFRRDGLFSLLLIVAAVGVIIVAILERNGTLVAPTGEPTYTAVLRSFVLFSVEASLAGLLAFSLIAGAVRVTRNRLTIETGIFLAALLVGLLLRAGLGALLPQSAATAQLNALGQSIVNAGASGILLGIALATLVTGIRVLLGQDRSYRE